MITNACNISEQHVFLGGATLGNLNSKDIKPILDKCIQVKPIHVKKENGNVNFCHLHFASKKDAATFFHFFSTMNMPVCSRLGKVYVRKAYDFNSKEVEYNVDLVEEVYHNSCICQGINDIPTSSKNSCICQSTNNISTSSNKNSVKDVNVSPSALSFYAERQEHLIGEIKQREKTLSRKRQEMDTANNW